MEAMMLRSSAASPPAGGVVAADDRGTLVLPVNQLIPSILTLPTPYPLINRLFAATDKVAHVLHKLHKDVEGHVHQEINRYYENIESG